jgi:hypothetical protein
MSHGLGLFAFKTGLISIESEQIWTLVDRVRYTKGRLEN